MINCRVKLMKNRYQAYSVIILDFCVLFYHLKYLFYLKNMIKLFYKMF